VTGSQFATVRQGLGLSLYQWGRAMLTPASSRFYVDLLAPGHIGQGAFSFHSHTRNGREWRQANQPRQWPIATALAAPQQQDQAREAR
jgi:hypothetical protein